MNKLKLFITSLAIVGGAMGAMSPAVVYAAPVDSAKDGVKAIGGSDSGNNISLGERIRSIVNILLYILGAIAVLMIIIGGIRYTTSNGDSGSLTSAKNTILYAVVGLVIAIMAFAIVNFVLTAFR